MYGVGAKQTQGNDHPAVYTNTESLGYTSEANMMLQDINDTRIKKDNNQTTQLFKKWPKNLNRHVARDGWNANQHRKRWSDSQSLQKCE